MIRESLSAPKLSSPLMCRMYVVNSDMYDICRILRGVNLSLPDLSANLKGL